MGDANAVVSNYVVPQKLAAVLKSGWITRNEIGVPIWWEREPIKRDRQGIFCGEWDHSSENWHSHAMMLVGIDDKLLPPIEIPWEQCKFRVHPDFLVETVRKKLRVFNYTQKGATAAVLDRIPDLGTPSRINQELLLLRREVTAPKIIERCFPFGNMWESNVTLKFANRDVPPPPDRLPPILINDAIPYATALEARDRE